MLRIISVTGSYSALIVMRTFQEIRLQLGTMAERSGPIVSRILFRTRGLHRRTWTDIPLGSTSPLSSSNLPKIPAGPAALPRFPSVDSSLFGFASGGVYLARDVATPSGELLPHRFTRSDPHFHSPLKLPSLNSGCMSRWSAFCCPCSQIALPSR